MNLQSVYGKTVKCMHELSDFFDQESIIRDGSFAVTAFPRSTMSFGICYVASEASVYEANANEHISAVITNEQYIDRIHPGKALVKVEHPEYEYYLLHNKLYGDDKNNLVNESDIHESAVIADSAIIYHPVIIEEGVVIDDYAIIYKNTIIHKGCYIGPGVRLGAKGMQNVKIDSKLFKIEYAGGVRIKEGSEILANAVIQKPYHAFFTTIGADSQVSVNVGVGHGAQVGDGCMIAGGALLAGNVQLGNQVWVGPKSVIADGVKVVGQTKILIGSVVVADIVEAKTVSGNFAIDHKIRLQLHAKNRKLHNDKTV